MKNGECPYLIANDYIHDCETSYYCEAIARIADLVRDVDGLRAALLVYEEAEPKDAERIAELEAECERLRNDVESIAQARLDERTAQRAFEDADEKKMNRLRLEAESWKSAHEGQARNTIAFMDDCEELKLQLTSAREAGAREFAEWCDLNVNAVRTGPNQYETIKMMLARFLASGAGNTGEKDGGGR